MTEQSDWHLPKSTVTRAADLRPDPGTAALTDGERAALATHPWLRDGLVVEFLVDGALDRARFVAWRLQHGLLREVA